MANISSDLSENKEDKEILELWHDSSWIGSYRGIKTFQTFLKTDKNINISTRRLTNILKNDNLYLMHLKPKRNIPRRHYFLNNYGELLQADLGYMFDFEGYKYFLLVIDCYSLKIFVKSVQNKNSETILKAFKDILNLFKTTVYKIEVDQGTEFTLVSKYCKSNNIVFKFKYGQNKANFAEWGILMIKRRLYKILRGSLSQDWPQEIQKVTEDHNNTPQKKLGFLKPNDINNSFDSAKVYKIKQLRGIPHLLEPTYQQQRKNEDEYNHKKNALKVNDFVYIDFKQSLFGKSFDVQVYYIALLFNTFCLLLTTS